MAKILGHLAHKLVFYEPPAGLRPLQLGMVNSYGRMSNEFITATIVDLAARHCLTIAEVEGGKDWELRLLVANPPVLPYERSVLRGIFTTLEEGATVKASSLSKVFYTHIPSIRDEAKRGLYEEDILDKASEGKQALMLALGVLLLGGMAGMFILSNNLNPMTNWLEYAPYSVSVSGVLVIIISMLMGRRSEKGARIEYELKGFKEFLSATEKYRALFNEEQGIIEKLLPYAVLFGITERFLKGLRSIYTEEQLRGMYPVWYLPLSTGDTGLASFAGFADNLQDITDQVSEWAGSMPSSSGSGGFGGGGFSGGGFGGGGGGSW